MVGHARPADAPRRPEGIPGGAAGLGLVAGEDGIAGGPLGQAGDDLKPGRVRSSGNDAPSLAGP